MLTSDSMVVFAERWDKMPKPNNYKFIITIV